MGHGARGTGHRRTGSYLTIQKGFTHSKKEYFSSVKAMHVLCYTYILSREALRKVVEWYRTNG